jgi:hydroxymethylglutaryl-CoA reductase
MARPAKAPKIKEKIAMAEIVTRSDIMDDLKKNTVSFANGDHRRNSFVDYLTMMGDFLIMRYIYIDV